MELSQRIPAWILVSVLVLVCTQFLMVSVATISSSIMNERQESYMSSHAMTPLPKPYEDEHWRFQSAESKNIRKWGCDRTETPFVFVHIGKAGGGSVRARIAASSLNYTSQEVLEQDMSYYPIDNSTIARACNSCFSHRRPVWERHFEGCHVCQASTPLGRAIACPEHTKRYNRIKTTDPGVCSLDADECRLVFMGHTIFGSEMHWLPGPYLSKWWSYRFGKNSFSSLWERLSPNHASWCPRFNTSRPYNKQDYIDLYSNCSIPLQGHADARATQSLSHLLPSNDQSIITSWAPIYASLPVLRVTLVRDPFSWLVSKFFWHRKDKIEQQQKCDNIAFGVQREIHVPTNKSAMGSVGPGWINRMSLGYIMFLCGEDCIVRYDTGTATLEDLELQAESNLRQGFAVVGVMEDGDHVFYDMLSTRIRYIDTSLNPHVQGKRHSTGTREEVLDCQGRFQDPVLQTQLLKESRELRVLNRLYLVAKEVNEFQRKELEECSGKSFGE